MHETAMENGKYFFEAYVKGLENIVIVDVGSQDVNGSLKSMAPVANNKYIGVDFVQGKGVDVIIDDPYVMPFDDNSIDVVVSSSCFEHSEFFWLLFNEVLRILKPNGLLYINSPSNGLFHRYPVDCWRFYPDSGVALQNWGRRSGYPVVMLESFIGMQKARNCTDLSRSWNDFVAVFLKDENFLSNYPKRIIDAKIPFQNGRLYGKDEVLNYIEPSQDLMAHSKLLAIIENINQILKS